MRLQMHKTLVLVGLATFALLLSGTIAKAGRTLSFQEAMIASGSLNRPILVDFYASWCGPCKAFAKATQEDVAVQNALKNVIFIQTDAEKEGKELADLHRVNAYPTFVLMDAEGQPIDRWMGYNKDHFLEHLANALTDLSTIEEKRQRLEAEPNIRDATTLARFAETSSHFEKAVEYYRKAQELDPENDYTFEIFDATFAGSLRGAGYEVKDVREAADAVLASRDAELIDVLNTASSMRHVAMEVETPAMMVPFLEAAVARSANSADPDVQAVRARLLPLHALYVEKNEARATELKKTSMPEGWTDDPRQLNAYAWWCFENRTGMEEALEIAAKAVRLAQPGDEKAQLLDTQAELCNALGDCDLAVGLIKQAIEEDPENEYYAKQLERFEKALAEQQG